MLTDLLRVGVLCSKRAPGLDALLHHPARRVFFDIDCVITSELAFPECGVPVVTHPIRSFYDDFGASIRDMEVRRHYDDSTAEVLRHIGVDVVVLLGYRYVVTERMLSAFPHRIFNVHDSDLPRYPGLHATRDAIMAGENETRSTVHLVTARLDSGPVMARSEAFPVARFAHEAALAGETDIVRAYAFAHREWMMRCTWGDLVVNVLEQVAVAAA